MISLKLARTGRLGVGLQKMTLNFGVPGVSVTLQPWGHESCPFGHERANMEQNQKRTIFSGCLFFQVWCYSERPQKTCWKPMAFPFNLQEVIEL